ncbi:MAG: endonuclease, partial [Bacteroidota bacterium]
MRTIALLSLLNLGFSLFAQQTPPPNLTGSSLRAWIKSTFYDGEFTNLGYSQARRRMYNYIDNQNDTVFCVYGQYPDPVPFGGTTTFPNPINAEHTVPQSFFNSDEPMRADIHHLFPTHMDINSARGNLPFGEVPDNQTDRWMRLTTEQSSIPGSDIDSYSEVLNNTRFEPREDHKGDCARAIFYFYTVYPTQGGQISSVGNVQQLYQWHVLDPPSAYEIQRNNGIEQYQGNRNPYIDHPDWVADAWEITPDPMERPVAPVGLSLSVLSSGLQLTWTDGPDELGYYLYRATGNGNFEPLATLNMDSESYLDGSVLNDQLYRYLLLGYNLAGESFPSDTVAGTLPSAGLGGLATDLLISEYVEGTTFNKGLEISNFTGGSINLASYALVK